VRKQLGWKVDNEALLEGLEDIDRRGPSKTDMYFNYHATKLFSSVGGELEKRWQVRLYDWLIEEQSEEGITAGTWYVGGGTHSGNRCGRLGVSVFATMMLQMHDEPAAMK